MSTTQTENTKKWYQSNAIFYIALFLLVLFSLLLFDLKIAIGGDDAEYIVSAKNFFDGISFPGWHGAMYPIFLSLPYALFGFSITIFKIISLLLIIIQFIFFYLTFKDRIKLSILISGLFVLSINYFILYNASQTSSEPLYLALQAIVLYFFFKIDDIKELKLTKDWYKWILLGFFVFLLTQTRNIGYSFIIAAILFFFINKKFRSIIYFLIGYLIFLIPFNLYKHFVWEKQGIGLESQFNVMFFKDPYNLALGYENFNGFADRFIFNINFYFSNAIVKLFGFRSIYDAGTNWLITIIIVCIFIFVLYKTFTNNKYLFFICCFTYITLGATFITQQTRWEQIRLMLILLPFFLLIIFYFFDNLSFGKIKNTKYMLPLALMAIFIGNACMTLNEIKKKVSDKHPKNDKLYGYTPDYKHYIQACQWVGKNIEKDKLIGCRKPHIGIIYSDGSKFIGIYNILSYNINAVKCRYSHSFIMDLSGYLKYMPYENKFGLRSYFQCFLVGNGACYVLNSIPDSIANGYATLLNKLKIPFSNNLDIFRNNLVKMDNKSAAVYPDSTLKQLKRLKIDYTIYSTLR
jgi:hypothetical protein